MIQIEKGVKIEKGNKIKLSESLSVYPIAEMEVGDSFAVSTDENETIGKLQTKLLNIAKRYVLQLNLNKKFTTRKVSKNTVRLWRIK